MRRKVAGTDPFTHLSWADVTDWAGTRIVERGRHYQERGLVENLSRTRDSSLVAWVEGTQRYATMVNIDGGQISSDCTCPYWDTCKHAVAVVLEYLHRLREGEEVPEVPDDDPRLVEVVEADGGRAPRPVSSRAGSGEHELRNRLAGMGRAQLVDLVEGLEQRHPEVRRELKDRWSIETGDVAGMVADLLSRIDDLSSEPGWSSHWGGGSRIPDYSGVRLRLEALLEGGHADEVLRVGIEPGFTSKRDGISSRRDGSTDVLVKTEDITSFVIRPTGRVGFHKPGQRSRGSTIDPPSTSR